MDVTVLMMSYGRRPNLVPIMKALSEQTCQPKEIIVINNEADVNLEVEGATVINCGRNFGPIIRPAIGLLVKTSHIMCHDDDVIVGPKVIENFLHWAEKLPPGSILGYEGRQIVEINERPYTRGAWEFVGSLREPREIDIVYAKCMFIEPGTFRHHWNIYHQIEDPQMDEDIYTTLSNLGTNYLIPTVPGAELTPLDGYGLALSDRDTYWEDRDRIANDVLKVMGRGKWVEAQKRRR